MSLIIDNTLVRQVHAYSTGQLTLSSLEEQIHQAPNASEVVTALMGEIVKASKNERNALNVKYTDPIDSLYDRLCILYQENLAIANIKSVAVQHIVRSSKKSENPVQLDTCEMLSNLLSCSKLALSESNFEPIRLVRNDDKPLAIVLRAYNPGIAETLIAAQKIFGPIHSLTLEYENFSDLELTAIIHACKDLRSLNVKSSHQFSDAVIENIEWPKNLSVLSVRDTDITKKGLTLLLERCTELNSLDIRGCNEITHLEMMEQSYCPTLVNFACDAFWTKAPADEEDDTDDIAMDRYSAHDFAEVCTLANQQLLSPVALTIAARTYFESFEPEKLQSQKWLTQALELNSQFIPAAITLREYQRTGAYQIAADPKTAEQQIDILIDSFKENPLLLAAKARFLLDKKDLEEAKILAQFAYSKTPDDDFILATFAEILRCEKNHTLARELCERALENNPRNVYALNCLACMSASEDTEKTIELYRTIRSIDFYHQQALVGLATGLLKFNKKETNLEAKKCLETAIQANPNLALAHLELAKLYLGEIAGIDKSDEKAFRHFEEAFRCEQLNLEILATFGEFLRTSGNIDRAEQMLTEADKLTKVQNVPKRHKDIHFSIETSLASIIMDQIAGSAQDRSRALELCEEAFSKKPRDTFLLASLGELLLPTDATRGLAYLNAVIEMNDTNVEDACVALANYYGVHDPETCQKLLDLAFKRAPLLNLKVLIAYAKFTFLSENFEKAQEYVDSALKLDPNSSEARVIQASLQISAGNLDDAGRNIDNILTNTKYGLQTRYDILVLLCENPMLMQGADRQRALKRLMQP